MLVDETRSAERLITEEEEEEDDDDENEEEEEILGRFMLLRESIEAVRIINFINKEKEQVDEVGSWSE